MQNVSPETEKFSTFFYGDYTIKPNGTDTHGDPVMFGPANNGVAHTAAEMPVVHIWELFGMTEEEYDKYCDERDKEYDQRQEEQKKTDNIFPVELNLNSSSLNVSNNSPKLVRKLKNLFNK